MWISKKRLHQIRQEAFEQGISKGYDLAWQLRRMDAGSKGCIISSEKVAHELNSILEKEDF